MNPCFALVLNLNYSTLNFNYLYFYFCFVVFSGLVPVLETETAIFITMTDIGGQGHEKGQGNVTDHVKSQKKGHGIHLKTCD